MQLTLNSTITHSIFGKGTIIEIRPRKCFSDIILVKFDSDNSIRKFNSESILPFLI